MVNRIPDRQGPRNEHQFRSIDSLFDSLAEAVCDKPGRSVTQMRQTAEYVGHVLAAPGHV